jgi:hypothetical protein
VVKGCCATAGTASAIVIFMGKSLLQIDHVMRNMWIVLASLSPSLQRELYNVARYGDPRK